MTTDNGEKKQQAYSDLLVAALLTESSPPNHQPMPSETHSLKAAETTAAIAISTNNLRFTASNNNSNNQNDKQKVEHCLGHQGVLEEHVSCPERSTTVARTTHGRS